VVAVRPAEADDVDRTCRTAMRAFVADPVMRWLYPDDDEYERGGGEVFRWPMLRWLMLGSLYTTPDCVGVAAWIPPGRPEATPDVPSLPHPPERLEKFAAIGAALAEHTPAELHWYLNLLATHPDWQRRGVGAALMDAVFALADGNGYPCYLETETLDNVAYYSHHGFRVRSEWDLPLDGPHMWGMIRQPGAIT
jgi:GNAT superfamily N-acetyltransferase